MPPTTSSIISRIPYKVLVCWITVLVFGYYFTSPSFTTNSQSGVENEILHPEGPIAYHTQSALLQKHTKAWMPQAIVFIAMGSLSQESLVEDALLATRLIGHWEQEIIVLTDRPACFNLYQKSTQSVTSRWTTIQVPSKPSLIEIKAMKAEIFNYLPEHITQVVYIDVDILVMRNLGPFLQDMTHLLYFFSKSNSFESPSLRGKEDVSNLAKLDQNNTEHGESLVDFAAFLDAKGHYVGFCSGCEKWHTGVMYLHRYHGKKCLASWASVLRSGRFDTDQESLDYAEAIGDCKRGMALPTRHLLFAKDYIGMILTSGHAFIHLTSANRLETQDYFYSKIIVPRIRNSLHPPLRPFTPGMRKNSFTAFTLTSSQLTDERPPYDKRNFHSKAIDDLISTLQPFFANPDVATLFSNCLPNTLDTTVYFTTQEPETKSANELDSFVITGDINAMWLRDSMNQVLPYIPYASEDNSLQYLLEGLINRQAKSILIDSFANAFNFNASNEGHQDDMRTPPMSASVFEGKYEIDSLNAFLKLSYWYWQYTNDDALLRIAENTDYWLPAVNKTLKTINTMQEDNGRLEFPPYLFRRTTSEALDTLMMQGRGPPCEPNGLTRSLFRPSDDAVTLPYNIPGNAMACVELQHLQEMLNKLSQTTTTNNEALKNVQQYAQSIQSSLCGAVNNLMKGSDITPYEIDNLGAQYFMDDANIPSLLSLPIIGYISSNNQVYRRTRDFVLSSKNPFYFEGKFARGIGGPHEGYSLVWPMAIIVQAMTSDDDEEIQECLQMLVSTTAGKGFMHESFDVNNPNRYTRDWFAWANGLFGELILQLIVTKPHIVLKNDPEIIAKAQSLVKIPVSLRSQQQVLIN